MVDVWLVTGLVTGVAALSGLALMAAVYNIIR